LGDLAAVAADCTDCDLYRDATQTVFGSGKARSPLVLIGEQPGDVEDRRGRPFVGPAGALLWQALAAAQIDTDDVYVTNAVKHFRWEPRGKRRIHKTPGTEHVRACHHWLESELDIIRPRLVVLLGATATKSVAPEMRVMRDRGTVRDRDGQATMVTVHPSAVLRADDRDQALDAFTGDLRVARDWLSADAGPS
jgi:DNA polymerase